MTQFSASRPRTVSPFVWVAIAFLLGLAAPVSAQRSLVEDDLKPIPSGPGIQVCEPVAPAGQEALADFGSGCGLWLQWSMGFHPQLGQTPRWDLAWRAAKELNVPRLRLSLDQAGRLSSILGVTHVAVGRITGTPAKCLLTYQLYAVPAEKAVGPPIKLAGTEEQIVAQLPEAARTILAGLGVQKPQAPASVGATAAELTTVGHYNWYERIKTVDANPQIDTLAKKLPLAMLLSFVHQDVGTEKEKSAAAQRLILAAKGNFLMLGAVAALMSPVPEEFGRAMDSHMAVPGATNNAVLAYWAIARASTPDAAVTAAERLVRLAPHSACAWKILGQKYSDQAETVRHSRYYSTLSVQERERIHGIYFHWFLAATQSTAIDPDYEPAWTELAIAGVFAEDHPYQEASFWKVADTAYWKAMDLDKSDWRLYMWGLDMYQAKWMSDAEKLAKVAQLASTAVFPTNSGLYDLGEKLQEAKFPKEAAAVFARAIAAQREEVRQHPNDATAHALLGNYLSEQGQDKEAEAELLSGIRLDPDASLGHYNLSELYRKQSRYPEMVVQLRENVRLTNEVNAKLSLAEALLFGLKTDQYAEPEKLLREILKVQPQWSRPVNDLGWVLTLEKQYDAALAAYTTAARLAPADSFAHREMGKVYRLQGKLSEAVREGEMAAALSPKDTRVLMSLAETYTLQGDNTSSLRVYHQALEATPEDASLHAAYGGFLLKTGKKDEGRAELKRALELKPTPELTKSTQELLDKNP